MKLFGELLSHYVDRTGISDAELARRLGVSRQTIFRWREGLTDRPRHREDVVDIAKSLRLTSEERDELLLSAGFSPERPRKPAPIDSAPMQSVATDRDARKPKKWWAVAVVGAGLLAMTSIAILIDSGDSASSGISPATADETLVLVSPFVSYGGEQTGFNVAGRLEEALTEQFSDSGLQDIRVGVLQEPILHDFAAAEMGDSYGAQLIVWGEYDSGRVIALLTPLGETKFTDTQERRWVLSTSEDLLTTINSDLPEEVRWLALYILGQIHLQAGRLDDAQVSLDSALSNPPEDPLALGGVYFQLGLLESRRQVPDLNKVIALYTEALELQQGHVSAINNRAVAYLARDSSGDLERAEQDLRTAVELVPFDPVYLTNLALALGRMGPDHLQEAIALFERAEEQAPEATNVQNSLCWFYAISGKADQALPHCDRAVEMDSSGYSNDSRGLAFALLGRFDEAIIEFQTFLDQLDDETYARFSPTRIAWIATLEAGQNPFDAATLQTLLTE